MATNIEVILGAIFSITTQAYGEGFSKHWDDIVF